MFQETPEEMGLDEIKDHLLVRAWLNEESGHEEPDHCLSQVEPARVAQATAELIRRELAEERDGVLKLRTGGQEQARSLIRRNRLAERLFGVVLNLSEEVVRSQACRLEHEKVLTPEAVEGICSFLGHPPTCPHGRPIPPGDCCRMFVNEVRPLVTPLSQVEVGESYRIVFIAPKYDALLERLGGLGVLPGATLRLLRKRPSYVLKVSETEVALDKEIAEGLYVVCQSNGH